MIGYKCDWCGDFFGGPGWINGWVLDRAGVAIDLARDVPLPPHHFCSTPCLAKWAAAQ